MLFFWTKLIANEGRMIRIPLSRFVDWNLKWVQLPRSFLTASHFKPLVISRLPRDTPMFQLRPTGIGENSLREVHGVQQDV